MTKHETHFGQQKKGGKSVADKNELRQKAERAQKAAHEADKLATCSLIVAAIGFIVAIVVNLDRIILFVNWLRSCLS